MRCCIVVDIDAHSLFDVVIDIQPVKMLALVCVCTFVCVSD